MSNPKKIVVTGAPGTGKTVIINELERRGYHCFHEIIRDMTALEKEKGSHQKFESNPLVFVDNPLDFNKKLLYGRAKHYEASEQLKTSICFFDRGIPDVLAYMDFFKQDYPSEFEVLSSEKTYNGVFIVPPWQEIYTSDNERLETFEEAKQLHEHLLTTYKRFGYQPIVVPKATVEKRTDFILQSIT